MGEKDLYALVRQIGARKKAQEWLQNQRYTKTSFLSDREPIPVPRKKAENRARLGNYSEPVLSEWEKNKLRPIFREYIGRPKQGISKDNLVLMLGRLATDECIIGKVPNVHQNQYKELFKDWNTNEDGLISWHMFAEGCNQWQWRKLDQADLEARINNFFVQAQKLKMQGQAALSHEMASKALRLEGAISSS